MTKEIEPKFEEEMEVEKNSKINKINRVALGGTILGIAAMVGIAWYYISGNVQKYEAKKFTQEHPNDAIAIAAKLEDTRANAIGLFDDEDSVLMTMNQMTHQKIAAEEKTGAVPMTKPNIEEVTEFVEDSDFEHKDEMLRILDKWAEGDFSNVDGDHDYILKMQDGTKGWSTGLFTPEEEAQFVLVNWGSKLD
jgi:hypothetical protein